ncbi:MAG: hypothetical protein ABI165_02870 [Bryobacteraceae bacterium]
MTRRDWLALGIGAPAMAAGAPETPCAPSTSRTKTAVIATVYRYNSHADVLIGRLLAGYSSNAVWTPSNTHVVSFHADQTPAIDMSRDLAARNGFHIYPSIREALTLGGKPLAVDAVVFVGEHGEYPYNDVGQHLYPRYELFSQIMDVYEQSGRSVPTYFDKHFSYSWKKAEAIYRRAKKIGFPFMAGSSIPLTIRRPALDPPLETPITEAVAIGYGELDAYGFHTLEGLQCLVERRKGGETGIASVEWIEGRNIWAWLASAQGSWAKPLLESAMRLQPEPLPLPIEEQTKQPPVLFVLKYRDGLKAAALMLGQDQENWTAAIRVNGQAAPLATAFITPPGPPFRSFDGLARCVDVFLATGKAPGPVERTLLTTGALAFCFDSKRAGKAVDTPELQVRYRGPVHSWFETA